MVAERENGMTGKIDGSRREKFENSRKTERLRQVLEQAETVVIGAGAGLSTAAGFTYTGERFQKYFQDFINRYGFRDMYSGGFYPFPTLNEHWAYWSRYIYVNRYMNPSKSVYQKLYEFVKDKDYFVLTTNVDHCFQKAGFDKERLYYTQGDYGLLQCSGPCHEKTYDNGETVRAMVEAQGFRIVQGGCLNAPTGNVRRAGDDPRQTAGGLDQPEALYLSEGDLYLPEGASPSTEVPDELVPYCPVCGKPMRMNLRADDTFVQDEGWYLAAKRYEAFLEKCMDKRTVLLELGVGYNTPGIIKYPFWRMTAENPNATYVYANLGESCVPTEIRDRSICINVDIGKVFEQL